MANHYSGKRVAGRKPVGKRALSLLMALVMSLSLVQITAFAVDTTGTTQKDAEVVFSGGSKNDGTVKVSKTVKKAAGTNDFEITLTVTVPKDQTIETGEGANVVLVMDRSNSMAGKGFENAKKAATAFVNKLMEKGGNKVAVVGFGNNYEVSSELTGDKSAALKAVDAATKSFPKNWYETSSSMGGTNIQAGIYAARNILAGHEGEQNFIIVFSDGKPTFSYLLAGKWTGCKETWLGHKWNSGGYGTLTGGYVYTESFDTDYLNGNGQDLGFQNTKAGYTCEHGEMLVRGTKKGGNNGDPAVAEAKLAKDASAVIYSVYVGKDQEATDTMKKVASDGKYYSSEDMDELTKLFGGIVEEVIATTAKSVVDPMGAQIVLGDVSNLAGVTKTADGLTWNPTAEGVKCTVNEDGSKTYEVTYPITLNTDAATGFVAEKAYETNGKTTFTYSVDKKEYTIDFPIPTVKGYLPETEPPVATETSYTVEHHYYINNVKVDMDEVTTTGNGSVGDTVTLGDTNLRFMYADKTYTSYEANPGMSIELVGDASKNVIVVSYYLAEEPETKMSSYPVVYRYFTNGAEDENLGDTQAVSAEAGKTIVATDVPLREMEGYTLVSITTNEEDIFDNAFAEFAVNETATANPTVYVVYTRETTPEKEPSGYSVHHSYYTNNKFDGESYEWVSEGLYVGDVIENATDVKTDYPTTFKDNEYELTEIDGLPLTLSETITENVIEVRYDRTVEVEPEVRYTVLHEYYVKGADTAEARLVEYFVAKPNQEVTLESITPVTQPSKLNENLKDYTYDFVSGTPDKLTVTADGDTFVLRYERTVEINPDPIPTTYTVKHEYYTNGVRDDKGEVVDEEIAGRVGEGVGVTTCDWKQTYGGNNYGSPTATPIQIVLVEDAKENVITLRYDRTTSTPVNPPVNPPVTTYDYYTVTVNYLDKDSGAVIHEKYSTTQREHTTYDVTAQDKIAIEGYTYVETTGDALTGTLNGSKAINVYYSKTTDIDDGDTPTTPAEPGSDIGDDDVPTTPAQPPKTGDSMGLWIAAALVSGMGLVWLALSGKKREERA